MPPAPLGHNRTIFELKRKVPFTFFKRNHPFNRTIFGIETTHLWNQMKLLASEGVLHGSCSISMLSNSLRCVYDENNVGKSSNSIQKKTKSKTTYTPLKKSWVPQLWIHLVNPKYSAIFAKYPYDKSISDTVTVPDQGMLETMQHAKVGDDVFREDQRSMPSERMSDMFGMEDALCPSGTMTNQIEIRLHLQPTEEIIYDVSHIYQSETGGLRI